MRALGIDFGEKRIGLAVSAPDSRLALPLATLSRAGDREAIAAIADIARREEVELLIIGDPVNLDGSRGDASRRVDRFAARLAAATGLPVERVPEALTSRQAEKRLREAGVDPRRHPERIDAVAAQILLEDALAARSDPRRVP
jgi:putative Holliday junction resolvase